MSDTAPDQCDSPERPQGRRFSFRCLRCRSVLEACVSQCGQVAHCPSCNARFKVPDINEYTGGAATDADPGNDGELPTPVHAYAAAGKMAPRIVRLPDDSLVIECVQCGRRSPITANACENCLIPFTWEGMGAVARPDSANAVIFLGLIGVLTAFCAGFGFIPGVIAAILASRNLQQSAGTRGKNMVGLILGLLACLLGTASLMVMFG